MVTTIPWHLAKEGCRIDSLLARVPLTKFPLFFHDAQLSFDLLWILQSIFGPLPKIKIAA